MSTSKTIVLVINDLKGNGAERVVITLADQLHKEGHQCHIICFKKLQELPSAHTLNIHIFPMQWLRWLPRRWRPLLLAPLLDYFIQKIARDTVDLILSNLLPADRILSNSRLPNVHLVVHNTLSKELLDNKPPQLRQQTLNQLSHIYTRKPVVCVSQGVLNDFRQLFPQHTRTQYIYNPVDAQWVRQHSTLPNPLPLKNYLVHVGKFKAAKRHDRLLRAYAQSGVQLPLVLVGQGPLMLENKTLAATLNISQRVIYAGFHANPYPIMAGATAMILSSDYEGLGLVILEATALGIPVISTDCPSGPGEILPPANLVACEDTVGLAEKIRTVCFEPDTFKSNFKEQCLPEHATHAYLALTSV